MGNGKKILLTILIFLVLGAGGWFAYNFFTLTPASSSTASTTSQVATVYEFTPKVFPSPAPGMALYQSQLFRFRLLYPVELKVLEYNEGRGTTIVFENAELGLGFQIFVVPHEGEQVSEERFKMDIPSGVMRDSIDIVVGGTRAQAFVSENAVLGDTREIWLLKNGFLYEVTTHKSLDEWLSGIIGTWQFF